MIRAVGTILFFLFAVVSAPAVHAQSVTLTIGTLNVESGGATWGAIKKRLMDGPRVDLWAFQEVPGKFWVQQFEKGMKDAHGGKWVGRLGMSGIYPKSDFDDDRLAVIFDESVLVDPLAGQKFKVNTFSLAKEMEAECGARRSRAPMVTDVRYGAGGKKLYVVNVHLQRDEKYNKCQAGMLRKWANGKSTPIVVLGDFNFDMNPNRISDRRPGFDEITKGGVFQWVKPKPFGRTYCKIDSYLDFIFVAGPAKSWPAEAEILYQSDATYCGRKEESDHLPVIVTLKAN